jgi:hypothetical protein
MYFHEQAWFRALCAWRSNVEAKHNIKNYYLELPRASEGTLSCCPRLHFAVVCIHFRFKAG